jgi:Holliday junction resolvase RusA-like endonuclease
LIDLSAVDSTEDTPKKDRKSRPRKKTRVGHFKTPADDDDEVVVTAEKIKFRVVGRPVPKKRVAHGWNGNKYNPCKALEEDFAATARSILSRLGKSDAKFGKNSFLSVTMDFSFESPAKSRSLHFLKTVGDIDNLSKFALDALNGVLYEDDRQILSIKATKNIAGEAQLPSILVEITEIANDETI